MGLNKIQRKMLLKDRRTKMNLTDKQSMLSDRTLFENLNNLKTVKNIIYFIGDNIGNTKLILSYENNNKKICAYADEWLYLINVYYQQNHPYYSFLVNNYNDLISSDVTDKSFSDYDVIPFITSFSTGTAHGYSGIFYILKEYINNIEHFKNYHIAIYIDSSQGILDIINHFININIIDRNKIIKLSSSKKYLFKSIHFISNKWHQYPITLNLKLIKRYIVNKDKSSEYLNNCSKICIIKNSGSINKTESGIVPRKKAEYFSNRNNLRFIEPTEMNEIDLINTLFYTTLFVVSWGTAFFKNYIYLSNRCKKIIVLVIGSDFITQYNNYRKENILFNKYKNADIVYHILDYNLKLDI